MISVGKAATHDTFPSPVETGEGVGSEGNRRDDSG